MKTFVSDLIPRPPGPPAPQVTGQLDLEIGAGVGLHAIRYSQNHPERHLIAIERTKAKFDKMFRRVQNHPHIQNLTVVHGDAVAWVTHYLPDQSVERIFILYPNPEPKNPAKRWARMPFMERLLKSLKPGGEILLATNINDYAEEARAYFVGQWNLNLTGFRELPADFPARTHFERKYLARGETCFELIVRKS